MIRKGNQGKRTDPDVREAIEDLAIRGWSPSKIADMLSMRDLGPRVPSVRTIQTIASNATRQDDSRAWSSTNATSEELMAVLPVLAWLVEHTAIRGLTVNEARALMSLGSYAPDLPELTRFWIARRLAAAREPGGLTTELDLYLAFAPWRDGGRRYSSAFVAGKVRTYLRFGGVQESPETTQLIRAHMAQREERRQGNVPRSEEE